MRIHLAAASLAVLTATACSEDAKVRSPEDPFAGHWKSNCVAQHFSTFAAPVKFGITSRSALKIEGNTITETTYVTADGCEGNDVEIKVTGTIKKEGFTKEGQVLPIDIHFDHYQVKAITEMGKRMMSLREWCGIKDWAIGTARDVTSQVGSEHCFLEKEFYTVHQIDGESLLFGNRENVSTAVKRPHQLVKDLIYTRDYGIFNAQDKE